MALRILVVDDDRLVRQVFTDAFTESGWEAVAVASGDVALEAIEQHHFDALLIDKNMPGMSGIDLVQQVRRTNERVVCAIITGYPSAESAMRAMELGIDAYIEKPAPDPYWVVDRIEALVRKRAQRLDLLAVSRGRSATDRTPVLRAVVASESAVDAGTVEAWLRDQDLAVESLISPSQAMMSGALARKPDLLVLDVALARPSLTALLEELRVARSNTTCVVLAEYAPALRAVVEFIELDVAAVLERSVNTEVLEERLRPLLRRLRAQRAVR